MKSIHLVGLGLVLAALFGASNMVEQAAAERLPPIAAWQMAALSPEDWGVDVETLIDIPGTGNVYGRLMQRRGANPIETVSVFIWDGSAVSPSEAFADYGIGPRLGLMQTQLPPVEPPSSLGPDAITTAHTLDILGRLSTTVRVGWRHAGWTIVLSAASTDSPDAAVAPALQLAERQQTKLLATFMPPPPAQS